ncbi:hypothetical protein C1646_678098 [Rhizophagus diaphanus]|nr:hypothetical protein C1646_678098 [Rhizophagus diaphanus] [Rhizophagus sp. MUCL 43196]
MTENLIELNEKLAEEWPIQIAKFGQKLIASEVRYYIEFQEYPNTSETGFASIYNVSGWDENEARKAFSMTNIQYSYGGNGTIRTVKNCDFFPGFEVSKEERKCLGVKMCEFASKELLDVSHTSVDFTSSIFKNTFNANEKFYEKATLCLFAKANEYKCGYVDRNGIRCDGVPKLGEFTQVVGSIVSTKKFIGCTKWQSSEKNHRYLTIPNNIDLELLETMFNNHSYHSHGIDFEKDKSDAMDECFTECPFIVTVSVEIHNHLPPPPRKTPYNIKSQLQKIIDNEHVLDLTARKFLTGSMIQTYLNGKSISDLHPSLNNQSKINYYIEKTRCSKYPFGQNILGVVHEFMRHEKSEDPYIRSIRK